jgi:hypothetical protein
VFGGGGGGGGERETSITTRNSNLKLDNGVVFYFSLG